HILFAREGCYVSGSRGIITEMLTQKVLSGEITSLSALTKGVRNSNNAMRIPIISILYRVLGPTRSPRSCNLGVWRRDLVRVNGFDEGFEGWGYEDTELGLRLNNNGVHQRCMKFRGIVFHLHHKISSRDNKEKNEQRYLESIREHRTRCEKGLDRHLTPRITYTEKGVAAGIGG
ncbi:MAG: galactosyltransferase-related protein, partial [Alistipes senegalensis]|nr:galactosyltransferase-related protein [Alistipes senegalensis]